METSAFSVFSFLSKIEAKVPGDLCLLFEYLALQRLWTLFRWCRDWTITQLHSYREKSVVKSPYSWCHCSPGDWCVLSSKTLRALSILSYMPRSWTKLGNTSVPQPCLYTKPLWGHNGAPLLLSSPHPDAACLPEPKPKVVPWRTKRHGVLHPWGRTVAASWPPWHPQKSQGFPATLHGQVTLLWWPGQCSPSPNCSKKRRRRRCSDNRNTISVWGARNIQEIFLEEHPGHKWTGRLHASHSPGRAAAAETSGSVHGDVLPMGTSYLPMEQLMDFQLKTWSRLQMNVIFKSLSCMHLDVIQNV